MTWTFDIATGETMHNGLRVGTGYSGTGEGLNNPGMVDVKNVGPIPPGRYDIGDAYDDKRLGPCVMHLDPQAGTEVFGRSAFRIHGDNSAHDASHGCVILKAGARRAIAMSADKVLEVFTGE